MDDYKEQLLTYVKEIDYDLRHGILDGAKYFSNFSGWEEWTHELYAILSLIFNTPKDQPPIKEIPILLLSWAVKPRYSKFYKELSQLGRMEIDDREKAVSLAVFNALKRILNKKSLSSLEKTGLLIRPEQEQEQKHENSEKLYPLRDWEIIMETLNHLVSLMKKTSE